MKHLILSTVVAVTLISCGPSTKIVNTWMEPNASITQGPSNKTLVIAVVKDESSRRIIEDQLVKRLKGIGIASYTMLPPDLLKDANESTVKQKLEEGRFTHLLVMRLGDIQTETTYTPGTTTAYYGGYGRYYAHGAGFYSTPGYYSTDKNYFVETTVYTVNPDKLVWTGSTKTVNPSGMSKTVNEIADVVSDKMKKQGFLK